VVDKNISVLVYVYISIMVYKRKVFVTVNGVDMFIK